MYFKQIDALRCYAALQVIVLHMHYEGGPYLFTELLWSVSGVPLFFIISGFLITGILLDRKANSQEGVKASLKVFYIRRALRIFPIYYLTVLVVLVFVPAYRGNSVYDLFYLSNWRYGLLGYFPDSPVPHFWSLAVEEQFYLIWPLLILLVNPRYIFHTLAGILIAAGVGHAVLYEMGLAFFSAATISCLCFLGSGALLAWLWKSKQWIFRRISDLFLPLIIIHFAIIAGTFYYPVNFPDLAKFFFSLLVSTAIVARFAIGFEGRIARALTENKAVVYLGKISYGLYVYHLLAIFPLSVFKKIFGAEMIYSHNVEATVKIGLTVIIAALSWQFIEKPINNLKDKFNYAKKKG
jgi:peptidoglycan/LPS O-acetylase OafA/YrhL